jgi:hypothetical protein
MAVNSAFARFRPLSCLEKGMGMNGETFGVFAKRRQRIIVISIFITLFAAVAVAQDGKTIRRPSIDIGAPSDAPAALVRDLYKAHNNGEGHIFQAKSKDSLLKYFDKNLADLFWRNLTQTSNGEVGNLDFDPLYNAQDTDIKNFQVGQPKIEGGRATVAVSFLNFDQKTNITFQLSQTQQGWRISNIIYDDGSNLVKILSQH